MVRVSVNKKFVGIPLALVILVVGWFLPPIEGLTHEGIVGLAILFAAVAMWICETLPMGVTGLLALVLAPLLGIAEINTVFSGFGTTTVIFAMAVFSLTAIVMKSDLAIRLTGFLVRIAGRDSRKLVLAFMVAGGLLSAVMNDSATLVLFLGFADTVLENAGHVKGKSNLAKCLYLGSAFAIFMGGMATPAGASINVLALGLVEQATGQTIPFLSWILAAAPVAIVMIPIIWVVLTRVFKPEPIDEESLRVLTAKAASLGSLTLEEKKTLVFLLGVPVLWIIGSWVPALNVTTVSVVALALMCAPGVRLLTFDEFQREVPWTIVIMIGAVISLGGIVGSTGGVAFLANLFLNSGVMELGMFLTFWLIVAAVYFTHSFVPVGPAFATILIPPLMTYCMSAGYSPAIPAILLAAILSGNLLLPINPGLALSYRDNVYTFGDAFKAGIIPVFCLITLLAAWVPFMVGVLGIPN